MLPRGRGEAENRACEGLGFAEVLFEMPVPAGSVDFGRFRRKWTKKGSFWLKIGRFWVILTENKLILDQNGPILDDF